MHVISRQHEDTLTVVTRPEEGSGPIVEITVRYEPGSQRPLVTVATLRHDGPLRLRANGTTCIDTIGD